ncbi:hypothetical protein BDP67DRAFT_490023 [Colletotrichum lupini]|nr:hypothetical protein BDP67DRAFT_490023 [Colletotrichum lupini]
MIAAPLACRKCQEPSATSSTRLTSKGCIGVTLRGRFGRQANTASVASVLSLALQTVGRGISGGPIRGQWSATKRSDSEVRMLFTGRWEGCDVFGQRCGAWLDASEGYEACRRLSRVSWSRDVDDRRICPIRGNTAAWQKPIMFVYEPARSIEVE